MYLTNLKYEIMRHTELMQDLSNLGYQLTSDIIFTLLIQNHTETFNKGEGGVVLEVITSTANNTKNQKNQKYHRRR